MQTAPAFVTRAVAGALFFGHGAQKLLGSFHGPGLDGAATMMSKFGYHPARRFAVVAALVEMIAGRCSWWAFSCRSPAQW